jgi:prepilin-type N-terminal cleavage/methylation domain-containing protein
MFRQAAFTLIELLIVMAIIIVLAGLILATSSYVSKKGQRSRAEAEIAAISAALENYKADNGVYPRGKSVATPQSGTPTYPVATTGTDDLNARTDLTATSSKYQEASRYAYEQLSGDLNLNLSPDSGTKNYMPFRESNLALIKDGSGKTVGLSHIKDPFGNSYGYSTAYQTNAANGYNPTFDLWSTCGDREPTETDQQYVGRWIKNW